MEDSPAIVLQTHTEVAALEGVIISSAFAGRNNQSE